MEHPLFIILGNDRIRLSSIKMYGISGYNSARELKEADEDIYNDILDYVKEECGIAPYVNYGSDYIDRQVSEFYKYTEYLYIKTFQEDYYEYYQVLEEFNIYKKLKELDSYLT